MNYFFLSSALVRLVLRLENAFIALLVFVIGQRSSGATDSIVVFRSSAIGDFICCLPALNYLRRTYPHARICLLTTATANKKFRNDVRFVSGASLLEGTSIVNDVHLLDGSRLTSVRYLLEIRRALRPLSPNRVILLPMTGESLSSKTKKLILLFVLGLTSNLTGYRVYQSSLLRKTQFSMCLWVHQVTSAMRAAGASIGEQALFGIERLPHVSEAVSAVWQHHGLNRAEASIAVFPGSKFSHRQWPADKFTELCKQIILETGARIVLIGGPQDVSLAAALQAKIGSVVNFTGQLSLLETAEVLRRCQLFIGNESGPAHLAAAVGTPTVSITTAIPFPGVWEPWGPRNMTVRIRTSCEYCFSEDHCPTGTMECIRNIPVDQVWQAVRVALTTKLASGIKCI